MSPHLSLVAQDLINTVDPVPIMVEEEVGYHGTATLPCIQRGPAGHPELTPVPPSHVVVHRAIHGEVPHLPPWC